MSKEDVIDYVMTTPGNPNKAVLEGILEDMGGVNVPTPTVEDAGKVLGVGDDGKYALEEKGYSYSGGMTILTEESVTTQVFTDSAYAVNGLAYSELIDADTIYVTFEGKKYTCQKRSGSAPGGESYEYGATFDSKTDLPDFSQFPFCIASSVFDGHSQNAFCTETAGTYQVKIESLNLDVEVTNCFKEAVKKCIIAPIIVKMTTSYGTVIEVSHSADEIYQAVKAGIPVTIWWNPSGSTNVFDTILYTTSFQNDELLFNSIPYNDGESKVQFGASIRNNDGTYEWQFNGNVA